MAMKFIKDIEQYRLRNIGDYSSFTGERMGAFLMPGPCGRALKILAADASDPVSHGWEHVSVSTDKRVPNWIEMCYVKKLFWDNEDTVVQFHPAMADYINCHPHCLHLWRYTKGEFPTPPTYLVGPKGERHGME